ncbi:MAG: hypothetical protein IJZ29_05315 [Clostridia bacterium]|nr:hypothetical protein [Clostridia bacterium]
MIKEDYLVNKDELEKIKDNACDYYFKLEELSKTLLIALLQYAIYKIDELENGGEDDCRDWKDNLCDCEFIFYNLINQFSNDIDDYNKVIEECSKGE